MAATGSEATDGWCRLPSLTATLRVAPPRRAARIRSVAEARCDNGRVRRPREIWILAALWLVLPLTVGPALSDVLDGWDGARGVLGEVLAWAAWAAGLLAVLRPHPVSLTVVRTGAALAFGVAAASATVADVGEAALALAGTAVLVGVAVQPRYGELCIDARSYGDERRFGLRMPPLFAAGPVPIAAGLVGAGAVTGPLLLADRRWVLGAVLTAVGLPIAALAARSLHSLSDRFVVLVPNGLVIHDPMTMGEPVLFLRPLVRDLAPGPAPGTVPVPPAGPTELLDLRAGASAGSVTLELREPVRIVRRAQGFRGGRIVETDCLLFAPSRPGHLLAIAADRRLPVRTA
jgi:hypothetical protein